MSDLSLLRGDTRSLTVTVVEPDGVTPVDISAIQQMWFTVKNRLSDADADAELQLTIGQGIVLTDAVGGIATITLTSTQTTALSGVFFWDVQIKDADDTITTVASGRVTFTEDATRVTS